MPKETNPARIILNEIADYARSRRGFQRRLAERMTKLGHETHPETLSRMLTENETRRVEPLWSTGIMLQRAFAELKAEEANETEA